MFIANCADHFDMWQFFRGSIVRHWPEGRTMTSFKQQFADLTSEYLLQMRARGDELSDEAHQAIEEIFAERGERLPEKPKTPIFITDNTAITSGAKGLFRSAALLILALVGMAVANALAHTWIGILITVGVIIYLIANWFRRQKLTPAQREREDNEKKAQKDGLTEIMACAANGDLKRIRELVEYGVDVNARSNSGTTALMYAARNNHLAVVEFLLTAGAIAKLESDKRSTAADIARKSGHHEIAARLEQHGTR